ncbi:MAG: glycine cleavage system aminomethyltransferase GcvT [Sedimentisphaerales bacterium]|nr:glycine cleavage system aminomethyltransferase GcvT [Sedimentisphaerales bacterium]
MAGNDSIGKFIFEQSVAEPAPSALYDQHLQLAGKSHIVDFAGYLMPLWFTSISAEHEAVRQNAGLFDCTHMGILEISGPDAANFLNTVATNDIDNLEEGKAQYSYILDTAGNVLDDIIIYQLERQRYMVIVNAANEPKIKAWFDSLLKGKAVIDTEQPARKLGANPIIRDMRNTKSGGECSVDIALQGPKSLEIITGLLGDKSVLNKIEQLKSFHFIRAKVADVDCIVSRTGYTGAKIGYEFFVHPDKAGRLWEALLDAGKESGLLPCGLGVRDSLRIEAGLPLYGHELAGPFNISPFEAGYGWAVKLEKDFFIGKTAMKQNSETHNMQVVRIELPGEKGIRPVRQNDGILDKDSKCIGYVLSCAKAGEKQIALAYIRKNYTEENTPVGIYYPARNKKQLENGKKKSVETGDLLRADIEGKIISRFARF